MAKSRLRLPWKYCECGCHGHAFGAGGFHFWKDGERMAVDQHGNIWAKEYPSSQAADDRVIAVLRRGRREIDRILRGRKSERSAKGGG
jgi:hypothetical protein